LTTRIVLCYTVRVMKIKLQISVMSARGWSPMFGHCYTSMIQHVMRNGIKNFELDEIIIDTTSGQSLIHDGRHQACVQAMQKGCTHILMLDDDMQFTPDLLDIFFNRRVAIIAANCLRKRDQQAEPTAIKLDNTIHFPENRTDMEEVLQVGTGIILISLNAIRHLPYPYFSSPWIDSINSHMGEDYYFCKKAREHGLKVHVDNLVSNASAHMGEFAFHYGNNFPLSGRSFSDLSHIRAIQKNPAVEEVLKLIN